MKNGFPAWVFIILGLYNIYNLFTKPVFTAWWWFDVALLASVLLILYMKWYDRSKKS